MHKRKEDDSRKIYERRLTREVQNVDLIIANINKVTADAINTLQEQKEIILAGAELAEEVHPEELEERIEDITIKTDIVHGKHERIIEKKESLNVQSEKILDLDKQIAVLQQERQEAIAVFLEKKDYLQERIRSIQNFDIGIEGLHFKGPCTSATDIDKGTMFRREGGSEGDEGSEEGEGGPILDHDIETLKVALLDYTFGDIKMLRGSQDVCVCPSSSTETTTATSTTESEGPSADCLYLQETVGVALKIALSEIIMKRPRDPIHYLGHFLLKFRLNQEQDIGKVKAFTSLLNERIRLENQRLHDMFLNEAQAAILELIIRAEEELIRRHLEALGENEEEGIAQIPPVSPT